VTWLGFHFCISFISNVEYFDNDMSAGAALVCTLALCMDEQDHREVSTK
jgi:hypothetical protein